MIRKSKGEFVATCEDCGAEFFGGVQDDFRAFVEDMKAEGWQVRKNGEDWEHYCEDCTL